MIFSVIPGNPSEMEFLYQEKVFVAGRVYLVQKANLSSWPSLSQDRITSILSLG